MRSKSLLISLCVMLCAMLCALLCCACTDCAVLCPAMNDPRMDNFAELREDYQRVARFAADVFEARDEDELFIYYDSETFFLHADDHYPFGRVELDCGEDVLAAAQRIEQLAYRPFSSIDVYSDHLIFWKDETGDYGVLCSDRPQDIIAERRDNVWDSFRFNRLDDHWYEIGQMR